MHVSAQPGVLCAPAKPTIRTSKRMRTSRGADPKRPTEGRLGTWEALTAPLAGSTLEVRAWAGRTAKTRTAAPNSARQENRASVASSDGRWVITAPATSTMVSLPARLILCLQRTSLPARCRK